MSPFLPALTTNYEYVSTHEMPHRHIGIKTDQTKFQLSLIWLHRTHTRTHTLTRAHKTELMQIELTEKLWAGKGKWEEGKGIGKGKGKRGPNPSDNAMKMTIIKFNVHTDACMHVEQVLPLCQCVCKCPLLTVKTFPTVLCPLAKF